jgi:hypothetical protein
MSNTFHNLNDFFSEPNFQDFECLRKPSIDESLLSFNNDGFTLDIEFVDSLMEAQPHCESPHGEPDMRFE